MPPNSIIYDLLLLAAILIFMNRWSRKNFGTSYFQMLKNLFTGKMTLEDLRNRAAGVPIVPDEMNYQDLFLKFVKITGMKPLEAFKLARTHMGFGLSDRRVEMDFDIFTRNISGGKLSDLPNYVEAFLEQGKEKIINATRYEA